MYLSTGDIVPILVAFALPAYTLMQRIQGLERQRDVMLSALVELGYGEFAYRAKTLKYLKRRYGLSRWGPWTDAKYDDPSLMSVLISVGPDWFCLACGALCAEDSLACGLPECVEYVGDGSSLHKPRRLKIKSGQSEE
jgi:hypothetical protein